ncbi:MAG: hypothetical protein R3E68_01470 [Burkholderiaceae bacterium]
MSKTADWLPSGVTLVRQAAAAIDPEANRHRRTASRCPTTSWSSPPA